MGYVGCFFLGLIAGVLGMWSSQHLDRSGCFLLGIVCGIAIILFFIWMLARTVKGSISQEQQQDDWWKKGEPPPWEK
jgi:hypothetical protein